MKKLLSIFICIFLLSGISAGAVGLEIEGTTVNSNMLFEDNTAYVPLSEMAQAMGVRYSFDAKTQSAFLNGINLFPEKSEGVKVYVNGKKYTPTDSSTPFIVRNSTIYLPAHLAAEAVGMNAKWYQDTSTLVFTKKELPVATFAPDETKTYAIVNLETSLSLTAGDNSLSASTYTSDKSQEFKFVKTEFDGYYNIQSVLTGKNLDVNGHGTTPGVSIITWDPGTGDNQKFTLENVAGGTLISARSCHLPIEVASSGGIIQNTKTLSDNQKWQIVEFGEAIKTNTEVATKIDIVYTPTEKDEPDESLPYRTFSIGELYLCDQDGLKAAQSDASDSFKWKVIEYSEDVYVIENLATVKSADVNARSLLAGASIITWQTSKDTNQRWIFEQNGDGSFYIKSVHSSLYLTLTDTNELVQQTKDSAFKQRWTISPSK